MHRNIPKTDIKIYKDILKEEGIRVVKSDLFGRYYSKVKTKEQQLNYLKSKIPCNLQATTLTSQSAEYDNTNSFMGK